MATTDGKTETKQESKPETKLESKEVEEIKEPPLKYKAWVLKVSIHCEGCRKKVERTLRKIDGVYEVSADLKQQKATVKANLHVNAETLIKKLVKKGRHAELLPEKTEPKEKKQGKSKNKDKQNGQANGEEAKNSNNEGGKEKEKETVKKEVSVRQEDGAKTNENGGGGSSKNAEDGCINVNKANDQGGAPRNNGGQVKEPKPEVKQNVPLMAGNQSSVAAAGAGGESEGNAAGGGEKSGSGSGSKKNKKKGQKSNANANVNIDEGEHPGDAAPAPIGSHFRGHGPLGPVPMPSPGNHSLPRQQPMYEYPTYHHAPPVYLTSYNTAYPSSSYTASYYTSPTPNAYAYMHPGHMSERPPPSDTDMYVSYPPPYSSYPSYASQPSDTFEMFSDENPNACSIM